MITKRDREIINFIYDFGFITIDQCAKTFYKGCVSAYDLARRRLKKLSETSNYIKPKTNSDTKQLIYIPKESQLKGVSLHDMLIMDYLAELNFIGADIEKCYIEREFDGIIPDAFIIFKFGGYRFYQILEVQIRHDVVNISRLEKIIPEVIKETNGYIPKVVIIQDTNKDYNVDNQTEFEIVQLKTDLEGVPKVVI